MFQGLGEDQLQGALEALLFVTDEPVSALRLSEILQIDITATNHALDSLAQNLAQQNRGIQLREVAGGWRLYTHPAYHELLEEYVLSWDTTKLSPAMLETLAIVAYSQPCTRAFVAATRGVTSDSSIVTLIKRGLLREAGISDAPGNPTLYATTPEFLEKFGLKSMADLPALENFVPDENTKELIRERLSARKITQVELDASGSQANVGADGAQSGASDKQADEDVERVGVGDADVAGVSSAGACADIAQVNIDDEQFGVQDMNSLETNKCSIEHEPQINPLDNLMFEIEDEDEILDVFDGSLSDDFLDVSQDGFSSLNSPDTKSDDPLNVSQDGFSSSDLQNPNSGESNLKLPLQNLQNPSPGERE